MIKKIIAIVLVSALFNMFAVSAFAYTEEDAEADRRQQRAVLACIGIVALVGTVYMMTRIGKDDFAESYYSSVSKNKPADSNFRIGFGFYNSNFNKQMSAKKERLDAPVMKLSYSW